MRWPALLFVGMRLVAQVPPAFQWPLDTPCIITGNYGELRPGHFHAGIDLATGGKINKPVYAAMDGYVSRIKVSAVGYGKVVYITHPNSRVTVYAHLNSMGLKLNRVVREEQIARKSFEVELLPAPGAITVRGGEVIGLSGNTGGSSGPHLHFEVRDEKSETPLNPLEIYHYPDTVAPVLEALAFYDLSDTLSPKLTRAAKIHSATVSQTFVVSHGIVGFGFAGYDMMHAGGSKNNIYSASISIDGRGVYSHTLRTIDFADNRFVNEFSETSGKLQLQRCFLPTLYPPRLFGPHHNKGVWKARDTLPHRIDILLRDERMNETRHSFTIISRMPDQNFASAEAVSPRFVRCDRDFMYDTAGLRVYIPGGTLYRSALLKVTNTINVSSRFALLPELNMRSAYVIAFKVPPAYSGLEGRMVLRSAGGVLPAAVRNDSVYFYPKNTGDFTLLADIEPPRIKTQLSPKKLRRMKKLRSMGFVITDRLSGIQNYTVTVNGKWVIAEYDAKNDLLSYDFDEETPRGPLNFEVTARDRVGNSKKFRYRLYR